MNWQPVVVSIGLLDLISWVVYLGAGRRCLAGVTDWRPDSSDARQLQKERGLELAALQGRWVMALQTMALILLVLGFSTLWPVYISGAMCGTGVLQAMAPFGSRTLFFRILTLALFYCWSVVEGLNRTQAEAVLYPTQSRLLLLAAPLMALSTGSFVQSIWAVRPETPVSCCAVVYELAAGSRPTIAAGDPSLPPRVWIGVFALTTLGVACWGWRVWRRQSDPGTATPAVAVLLMTAWAAVTWTALKAGAAPYVYEVLWHPCPWCFFLWEHHAVGFAYYGLALWILAQTAGGLTSEWVGRRHPTLIEPARRRLRQSGKRICLGSLILMTLVVSPAVFWRIRFGDWISGG